MSEKHFVVAAGGSSCGRAKSDAKDDDQGDTVQQRVDETPRQSVWRQDRNTADACRGGSKADMVDDIAILKK